MSLGLSRNRPLRLLAIAVGLCWLATVVLMSFYGNTRSLDQDEGFSVWLARPGWGHIARYIPMEPQPPLYFGSLSLWIRLVGDSEPRLRALSGLLFLVGMAAIWIVGRKALAPRQLRWVLVAMAASKLLLWQAIEARMYVPLEVEASLATLAYLGLITGRLSPRAGGFALFAISLVGVFTHYFYFYLLMAIAFHYIFLSGRYRLPILLGFAIAPALIFAALWGPMFWSQVRSNRFDQEEVNLLSTKFNSLPPTELLSNVDAYFGRRGFAIALPGIILLALVTRRAGRYRLVSRRELWEQIRRGMRSESFRAVATIWLFCMIVPYLVGLKTGLYKGLAVSILTLLPFILMVTFLFARCGDALLRCALALTLLGVTLVSDLRARHQMSHDPRSDRAWVRRIIDRSMPGDSVVCCTGNFFPLVDYYLRNDPVGARMRLFNFPEDLSRHPGWFNEQKVPGGRAGMEREARSLAAELSAIAGAEPGRKVWVILVTRIHPQTARILTDALRPTLSEIERIDVSGNFAFYDQILLFVTRREPGEARESGTVGEEAHR